MTLRLTGTWAFFAGLLFLSGLANGPAVAAPSETSHRPRGQETVAGTSIADPSTALPPTAKKPRIPPIGDVGTGVQAGLIVEICPTGCQYADLASACAAVKSTAEVPVIFHVGPGRYLSETPVSCSGQDHAVFRGSGPGVTILENTNQQGYSDYGTFEPGTSTNYVIEQFTLIGHRGVHMDMQLRGGGLITLRENEFRSPGFNLDEDCLFIKDPAPGSRIHLEHNRCEYKADGFTLKSDLGRDLQIYGKANHFTSAFDPSSYGAWHFESQPCVFVSQGESFDLGGARLDGGVLFTAYDFQNWNGGGCAAPAQYTILGPSVKIVNTDDPGDGGGGKFMNIGPDIDNIGQITIVGAQADISTTDMTCGWAYGIFDESRTPQVDVIGGRFRTSGGGNATVDFDGHVPGSRIRLYGVDHQTRVSAEGAGVNVQAGDLKVIRASDAADLGATTVTLPGPGDGLILYNARTTQHDASPALTFKTSPGGTGSKTWKLQATNQDRFTLTNPDGQVVLEWRTGGNAVDVTGGMNVSGAINMMSKGGEISLGDGTASDATRVRFNGVSDALLQWIESARRFQINGPDVLRLSPSLARPLSCAAGDIRVLLGGTYCFCTGPGIPGTWTGIGPGDCNN